MCRKIGALFKILSAATAGMYLAFVLRSCFFIILAYDE